MSRTLWIRVAVAALMTTLPLAAAIASQVASNNRHPSVSLDGRYVLFDSDRAGSWDIYVMDADGSNVRRLTSDHGDEMAAEWAAGGWITYARSDGPGSFPETYRMRADGSGAEPVEHPERVHWAWSPDREMVLTGSEEQGDHVIYIMNADGSGRRPLTTFSEGSFNSDMSFSPDGSKVVFESFVDNPGNGEIYVVNMDGSGPVRLTAGTDPQWSPNGALVAYKALNESGNWEISVIGADGAGERHLAEGWIPSWFPDSRRLAYFATIDGKDQIFVVDVRDGTQTQLTR